MSYESQLRAKSTIVRDALQRIGKRGDVSTVPVVPSPAAWGYRTKLTLALRWTGDRWIAGLHRFDDPDAVFQLEQCPITDDRILAIWRDILGASASLPRTRRLRGAVRLTADGASFVLEGGMQWPLARELGDRVPSLTTIWWQAAGGRRRLVVDRRGATSPGGASSHEPKSPDASFVQVNTPAAELLHAHVVTLALSHSPTTVIERTPAPGQPRSRSPNDASASPPSSSTRLRRGGWRHGCHANRDRWSRASRTRSGKRCRRTS
jgi:23S rRNA (uracil1939-C5)-methyltransferase